MSPWKAGQRMVPLVTAPRLETEAIASMLKGEGIEAWSAADREHGWSASLKRAYGCVVLVVDGALDRAIELLDEANEETPAIDLPELEREEREVGPGVRPESLG